MAVNGCFQGKTRCPDLPLRTSGYCQQQKIGLPQQVEHWPLTTFREKLIMIGAKVVQHSRYVTFQMEAAH